MNHEEYQHYLEELESETLVEYRKDDPVYKNIRYHSFVSKSKGRRNGKQRIRKHWKEIRLLSYQGGAFHLWHRFPFDRYTTECLGQIEDAERIFIDRIQTMELYQNPSLLRG
jgi:hypothetical protein